MADNTTNVNINVTDNGTSQKVTGNVKELKTLLDSTAASAGKVGAGVAAAAAPSGAARFAASRAESSDYGAVRASLGTGAAGRDFAKESQGLGGLVRVYATFAANIFAVTAAFQALKEAASFERLVKGTELLSVATGVNLGKVSKDLQEATGYAVSLQDSMKFTNIGVSAGLAGEQITRLAKIAKGAANVLGRDSTDSITRIIQGTAKQEQEILDELGIFIKAKAAYDKYAKDLNIKGGADALTAQQKVLAYANAVEEAGKKYNKFAEIEDPFSKFTATAKNSLTELLTAVNRVVVPLLSLLAESKGAIQGIILLIGGSLLQRALPELKKGISDFFTFDKRKVLDDAQASRNIIIEQAKEANKKLEELQLQYFKNKGALERSAGRKAIEDTVNDDSALARKRLATTLLGGTGNREDITRLTKIKEAADAEKLVLNVLKEQSKNKTFNIEQLVQEKTLAVGSTKENLVLGELSKKTAADILILAKSQTAELEKQALLGKEIAVQQKIAATANTAVAALPATGKAAGATSAAFNNQLVRTADIAREFDAKLGTSYVTSIKAFGTAMKAAAAETVVAGTSMLYAGTNAGVLAGAARTAAAGVGVLSIALKGVLATVSVLFLPLTILYTLYELFGDKIKEYLGITNAMTRLADGNKEALKSWSDSVGVAAAALENLNKRQKDVNGNADEALDILNKRASATNTLVAATSQLIAKLDEEIIKYEDSKKRKTAADKGITISDQELFVQRLLDNTNLTVEQANKLKLAMSNLYLAGEAQKSGLIDQVEYNKRLRTAMLAVTPVVNELNAAQQQAAANGNAFNKSMDDSEKGITAISKKQKGALQDLGFTTKEVEDTFTSFTDAVKNTNFDASSRAELLKKNLEGLSKVVKDSKPDVLEYITKIDNAKTSVDALGEELAKLSTDKDFISTLLKAFIEAEKIANATKAIARIKPYTDSEKASFIETERAIDDATAKIKLFDSISGNISAIDARAAAIRGFGLEENALATRRLAQLKAEEDFKKSAVQLGLETQKALKKRDAKGVLEAPAGSEQYNELQKSLTNGIMAAKNAREIANSAADQKFYLDQLQINVGKINVALEQEKLVQEEINSLRDQELNRAQALLDSQVSLGRLFESTAITKQDALAREITLQKKLSSLVALNSEKNAEVSRVNADTAIPQDQRDALIASINAKYAIRERLIKNAADAELSILDITKRTKEEQNNINIGLEERSKKLKEIEGFGEVLLSVFGKIGEGIGSIFKIIETNGQQQLQSEKSRADELTRIKNDAAASEMDKISDTAEVNSRYTKEGLQREIKKDIAVAASAKSMFKEKTLAYKAFGAVEKVMRLQEFALSAKAIAVSIAETATKITNSGLTAFAYAKEAIANAWAFFPPPFAPAAAAVVTGAMVALLGKAFRGGNGGGGFQMSKEQRQETQGTGYTYNSRGVKVETGGGVFGDAGAKSTSIADSLETIKKTSVEGLVFTNKMVTILESINTGINGAAKGIYSLVGIRVGSSFGTREGINTSGGLLGISGLFGKSTSKEITDSGIEISGLFKDLVNNVGGAIRAFETVQTTTKSSGFFGIGSSTSTSTGTQYASLDQTVSGQISSIFQNAQQLFTEAGKKIGFTTDSILEKLGNINIGNITASLRGLTGADLEKEFNSIIGSILDTTANALFSSLVKYREFGEGMLETVIRVTDNNDKVNLALKSLGKISLDASIQVREAMLGISSTAGDIALMSIDTSEAVIKAAGGLDEFLSKTKSFGDNFLSEAERLAPVQAAVVEEMKRLNLANIDTKKEFKDLVLALDLTVPAQRDLYASLLNVADSFNKVYASTEKVLTAEDLRTKLLEMEITKQKLLGNVSYSVQLARQEEINQLMLYPAEQAKALIASKLAIYALEDSTAKRQAEISVLKAQGKNYQALQEDRALELLALNDELRLIKARQYAAEDSVKTEGLLLELMDLQGKSLEATNIRRQKELKGLSSTDAALKMRIWRLQDEAALVNQRNDQEVKIYTLLGKSAEALVITRKKELETIDPQLRASQLYIYALEDEQSLKEKLIEARDKEASAIESTIDGLKGYIQTLKDYKLELLAGSNSILNPQQKYDQAKSEALRLSALSTSTGTSAAEVTARNTAIEKLPAATDKWLEASRVLFASSQAYTSDFNQVLNIIDTVTKSAETQLSLAEMQYSLIKKSTDFLDAISTNTLDSKTALDKYLLAQKETEDRRLAAVSGGSIAAGAITGTQLTVQEVTYTATSQALEPVVDWLNKVHVAVQEGANLAFSPTGTVTDANAKMLAELKSISEILTNLRLEQAQQTADIIGGNAVVTSDNAYIIVNGVAQANSRKNWQTNNQPTVNV